MNKAAIEIALSEATRVMAFSLNLPVLYPNIINDTIPPPDESDYIEVKHFPNVTDGYDWGSAIDIQTGIWQLGLVTTKRDGVDRLVIIDQIGSYFARGMEFRSGQTVVKIEQPPSLLTVIVDGQKSIYPVSIRYRC